MDHSVNKNTFTLNAGNMKIINQQINGFRNVRFIFVLTQHLNHATENMSDNAECYKAQGNA